MAAVTVALPVETSFYLGGRLSYLSTRLKMNTPSVLINAEEKKANVIGSSGKKAEIVTN